MFKAVRWTVGSSEQVVGQGDLLRFSCLKLSIALRRLASKPFADAMYRFLGKQIVALSVSSWTHRTRFHSHHAHSSCCEAEGACRFPTPRRGQGDHKLTDKDKAMYIITVALLRYEPCKFFNTPELLWGHEALSSVNTRVFTDVPNHSRSPDTTALHNVDLRQPISSIVLNGDGKVPKATGLLCEMLEASCWLG